MNSSEKAYERDKLIADFIECNCFNSDYSQKEYDNSIAEINAMIQHSIGIENDEEIAQWRKMLQRTRVEKRRAKARMIESKREMEFALT